MSTVFSQGRWEFTKKAHVAAETQFYPLMWPGGVAFEDVTKTAQDLDYAIDCQLAVTVDGLKAPIRMSIQERFRQPEGMDYGDITVTEWNLDTNLPSELHKLGAQMFVYGFYDESCDHIVLAVAVDVGLMQWALAHDELPYVRRRRGDQSFLGFRFGALRKLGAVLHVHDRRESTAA
ncbi:MAG: hypothetical protein ACRDP4_05655 [Nocardioidaceae bacterium]